MMISLWLIVMFASSFCLAFQAGCQLSYYYLNRSANVAVFLIPADGTHTHRWRSGSSTSRSGTTHCPPLYHQPISASAATQKSTPRANDDVVATDSSSEVKQMPSSTSRYEALRALVPRRRSASSSFAVERLEASSGYHSLWSRDRAFARLLVSTVERRQGQIDKILQNFQTKQQPTTTTTTNGAKLKRRIKGQRTDLYVQGVLRLGVAQLLFLRTPSHAACKETVDLLRMSDDDVPVSEGRIKFVNAMLRRISLEGDQVLPSTCVDDNVAPWLLEEWKQAWGEERTKMIVEQAMEESPRFLTVRQRPGATAAERNEMIQQVAQAFRESAATVQILAQGSIQILVPPPFLGTVSRWPGYDQGQWFIQDPSATIPAKALYHTLSAGGTQSVADINVVDMCAAPGGKTLQLCSHGFQSVTAVELSPKRCDRLRENLERLGFSCHIVVADGTKWRPDGENGVENENNENSNNNKVARTSIQGVLLDVPCTATGTGSRRPDVLRRDSNYSDLLHVQWALACHAVDNILDVGGIMVYATCSLLRQEGEDQMNRLVSSRSGLNHTAAHLEIVPFQRDEILDMPGCTVDNHGWLRVFPQKDHGLDGFFVGRVRKVR
ncbi:hypothetical protein ACA910_009078 [Epithemia clementina (nom. ined.)]